MQTRRLIWIIFLTVIVLLALAAMLIGTVWWYFHPPTDRVSSIVSTQRHGHALTFDMVRPAQPNGLGIEWYLRRP